MSPRFRYFLLCSSSRSSFRMVVSIHIWTYYVKLFRTIETNVFSVRRRAYDVLNSLPFVLRPLTEMQINALNGLEVEDRSVLANKMNLLRLGLSSCINYSNEKYIF